MSGNNTTEEVDWKAIREKAIKRAAGGGLAGSMAMFLQVGCLMWMRTTMNYQYRHGSSTTQAFKTLYAEGGIRRFYRGVGPALIQGPMSRFGDTAANTGMLVLLDSNPNTKDLPILTKTLAASAAASSWRIFLMPVDAVKTTLQVEGQRGLNVLMKKFRTSGNPLIFWHGSLAAVSATFVGHYPWFATFNYLDEKLPQADPDSKLQKLSRRAVQGFTASIISDTCSNSIRVIKTTRQTCEYPISYVGAARMVIDKDGLIGLFGRGLKTRILSNGVQGLMFSILWKSFEDIIFKKK
eukprot:CAMPEP_0202701946 /NCGR_PEP_ID=MMETSP1385-20130828/14984_1 /ASSEMBLY_ACC=CAM_ASM_000861 /TAXON_ID=933848 /ORGANISM="Elphidium margaritaceum" /LENGTH=294 /DNA_ID=CAMNT_0049359477 /DNA_START=64 /DNA_END=948 /DNA_ORIENTATION=-